MLGTGPGIDGRSSSHKRGSVNCHSNDASVDILSVQMGHSAGLVVLVQKPFVFHEHQGWQLQIRSVNAEVQDLVFRESDVCEPATGDSLTESSVDAEHLFLSSLIPRAGNGGSLDHIGRA